MNTYMSENAIGEFTAKVPSRLAAAVFFDSLLSFVDEPVAPQ